MFCIRFKNYHRFIYLFESYSINIFFIRIDYHLVQNIFCEYLEIKLDLNFLKFFEFISIFKILLISSNPSFKCIYSKNYLDLF